MDPLDGYGPRPTRLIPSSWVSVAIGLAFVLVVAFMAVNAVASQKPAAQITWDEEVPTQVQASEGQARATTGAAATGSVGRVLQPTQGVDQAWLSRVASVTGIPQRALLAYAAANLQLRVEKPGCALGWNTIAAIGLHESGHGSHAGSSIGEDGVARPAIIGMRLDGTQGNAAIRDTDDGVYDGDTQWDRAVGPMQFIPSTWTRNGADGNGDGLKDPGNIDDAALAAGRYLCAASSMNTPTAWRAAIQSYNNSTPYIDQIAASANRYAKQASGKS